MMTKYYLKDYFTELYPFLFIFSTNLSKIFCISLPLIILGPLEFIFF